MNRLITHVSLCLGGGMVDTTDSKSVASNSVRVQVSLEAPTSSFYSNIDKSENFEENQTEEYNPLEWAKHMAQVAPRTFRGLLSIKYPM